MGRIKTLATVSKSAFSVTKMATVPQKTLVPSLQLPVVRVPTVDTAVLTLRGDIAPSPCYTKAPKRTRLTVTTATPRGCGKRYKQSGNVVVGLRSVQPLKPVNKPPAKLYASVPSERKLPLRGEIRMQGKVTRSA